jgi:hypothetical protein
VIDGEGIPTRKFDGTCVMVNEEGGWWARREVKPGKPHPPNFHPEQTDEATGKTVGWEPAEQSSYWKYLTDALDHLADTPPAGTYELCGPNVNGNPEGFSHHVLVPHGAEVLEDLPCDFDSLKDYLTHTEYEGIVWHHPDGRMAKLKKRDFPLPPIAREETP